MPHGDKRIAGLGAASTILCVAILSWNCAPVLNLAAAAPLVLYLPGWAALRALGLEIEGWLESALVTVALSLAIVIIVGLALNEEASIARPQWVTALAFLTLAASAIAWAKGGRASTARASDVTRGPARWPRYRPMQIVEAAAAVGLAAVALGLSLRISIRHPQFFYTQLWIVPKQNAPNSVVIGLSNEEARAENYAIELLVDHHLVQSWSDVSLKPGDTWMKTFRWVGYGIYPHPIQPLRVSAATQAKPTATVAERTSLGARPRIEALVYRLDQRSVVYRRVWTAAECEMNEGSNGRPPCEF